MAALGRPDPHQVWQRTMRHATYQARVLDGGPAAPLRLRAVPKISVDDRSDRKFDRRLRTLRHPQ